ncbi:MAG: hypothetical protein WCI34_08370 [Actinomycetes bacterium]
MKDLQSKRLFATLFLLASMSGCGGGPSGTTAHSSNPNSAVASTTKKIPANSQGQERLTMFQSPSRRIKCILNAYDQTSTAGCQVLDAEWKVIDTSSECDQTSSSLMVADDGKAGKGVGRCDTMAGEQPHILRYGHSKEQEGISCRSDYVGITCRSSSGHGFFASKQGYKVF